MMRSPCNENNVSHCAKGLLTKHDTRIQAVTVLQGILDFFPYSQAHHPISLNNKRVHPGAEIMAQTGAQSSGATARGQNMIHTYTTQVNIHGRTL